MQPIKITLRLIMNIIILLFIGFCIKSKTKNSIDGVQNLCLKLKNPLPNHSFLRHKAVLTDLSKVLYVPFTYKTQLLLHQ